MIQGIVLAAGFGRRAGRPKALLRLAGEPFHQRALRAFSEAGLETIVVVNAVVQAELPEPGPGERRLLNPDPDQAGGMFASIRMGLRAAGGAGAEGVVLLPVDHPLVTPADILAVARALGEGAPIALATHAGRRGHPIGLSRAMMAEIEADPGLETLRQFVRRDPARVVHLEASEGTILGINTEEDLKRVTERGFR